MLIRWLRWILFPLAILYDVITRLRNHLYDSGYKPSFRFGVHTVVVGNLNVGGSGKTPMIEYLINLLRGEKKIATLSRGYGRRTRGFRLAAEGDEALTIGDEPFQIYRKFHENIAVAVGEERALAIPHILQELPQTDVILLDDAFQHRTVRGHLAILLTEYSNPFYSDWLLPTGNLREAGVCARRADVIVVTKCPPQMDVNRKLAMRQAVQGYAGNKPVFFSTLRYREPVSFGISTVLSDRVILVSGIANARGIEEYVRAGFKLARHFNFPDHHRYTRQELVEICEWARAQQCAVVTTEKDMVRLIRSDFSDLVKENPWFYLPIEMTFLESGADFDSLIKEKLNTSLN